jgi:Xaa-Pro aminopeptidase
MAKKAAIGEADFGKIGFTVPVTASLLRKYSQVFPVGSAGVKYPSHLIARRKAHLEALDSFAVFAGVPREPGSENLWIMSGLRIFQEPALIHLTGINQPKVILLLNPLARSGAREILFISEKDPGKEFWDGIRFGYPKHDTPESRRDLEELRTLTGIHDIRPIDGFDACFTDLVKKHPKPYGYTLFHSYRPAPGDEQRKGKILETRTDHNWAFKERLEKLVKKGGRKGFGIRTWVDKHFELRLPLEGHQVRDTGKAVRHTAEAFQETLARLSEFRDENELAAFLEGRMRARSPYGLSFPSIVAGGRNAPVLHYLKNDEPLETGSLVLLDFGVRHGTMHADITRTVPLGGKFNPLQALLYQIVLDAEKLTLKLAKPGETIRNINRQVWAFLEDQLEKRFLSQGGKSVRAYSGQPHGLSHLMGEQEHDGDPHRVYQDQPLREGWQISNEPGLYGHFTMTMAGKRYSEWIGIRIEDDLLITRTGCRNLSREIPKEIHEIEALIGPH